MHRTMSLKKKEADFPDDEQQACLKHVGLLLK